MRRFILKTLFVVAIIALCYVGIGYAFDAKGFSDWAYKRFTVDRQVSLIVGTSRSAQGIHPAVIDNYSSFSQLYAGPMYNFSFTVSASPYGEPYYRAIEKMLRYGEKRGLFILSVDPWGLSYWNDDNKDNLSERNLCLGKVPLLHCKPNIWYMLNYLNLRNVLDWRPESMMKLQDDGWLRVDFQMEDSVVRKNIKDKLDLYVQYKVTPSQYRLSWLKKTISLFQQYGDVYLCRVPVYSGMLQLEDVRWPNFDEVMEEIARVHHVPYFNFRYDCESYRTTDGNHLYKDDGARFTQALCDSIATYSSNVKKR